MFAFQRNPDVSFFADYFLLSYENTQSAPPTSWVGVMWREFGIPVSRPYFLKLALLAADHILHALESHDVTFLDLSLLNHKMKD